MCRRDGVSIGEQANEWTGDRGSNNLDGSFLDNVRGEAKVSQKRALTRNQLEQPLAGVDLPFRILAHADEHKPAVLCTSAEFIELRHGLNQFSYGCHSA